MTSPLALRQAHAIRHVRSGLVSRMAASLRRFFRDQAERVVSRYLHLVGTKAARPDPRDADPVLPAVEDVLLQNVIDAFTGAAIEEVGTLAAEMVAGIAFTSSGDPRLRALLAPGGMRIRRINEETRRAIMRTIWEGSRVGYTPYQIAHGVPSDGFRGLRDVVEETYRGRAETVARTELALAAQASAADRYGAAGVTMVEVMDGEGCGWTSHHDPDKADGKIVTLSFAQRYPIAHPNCRRLWLPYRPGWTSHPSRVNVPPIVRAS